jgi:GT2 family glycosyltransferase
MTRQPQTRGDVLSVAICTHNRADLLVGVLDTLFAQTADRADYEVIVVDNASTEATRQVVHSFAQRFANARYVHEPTVGLSHARNRAVQEATGEYVAYVDDDCRLPPHWVAAVRDVIARVRPAACGGPLLTWYASDRPRWYRDEYASHVQGDVPRPLGADEYLDGGNIALRRSLLAELGGFDPGLGMAGKRIAYGEETALLRRIRAERPHETIYYDPRIVAYHLVRPEKMTLRRIARQCLCSGYAAYHVFGPAPGCRGGGRVRLWKRAARALGALTAGFARALLFRDRRQFPYIQNDLCERVLPRLQTFGRIVEQCRQECG